MTRTTAATAKGSDSSSSSVGGEGEMYIIETSMRAASSE